MTDPRNDLRCVALFCGSRSWEDMAAIERDMAGLPPWALVVHGGAKGVDRHAGLAARRSGRHVAQVDALWDFYGKRAGFLRNSAMLLVQPTIAFAYTLGTPGTSNMIDQIREVGIPLELRLG